MCNAETDSFSLLGHNGIGEIRVVADVGKLRTPLTLLSVILFVYCVTVRHRSSFCAQGIAVMINIYIEIITRVSLGIGSIMYLE